MVDSSLIASVIAAWGFWVLLGLGWLRDELRPVGIAVFLGLWLLGFVGLRYVPSVGSLFTSYVAVLDIALVFVIFRGDVRLT